MPLIRTPGRLNTALVVCMLATCTAWAKPPGECIGDIEFEYQDQFLRQLLTTTQVTAFVEKNKSEYCRALIFSEFKRGRSGLTTNCLVTSEELLEKMVETFQRHIMLEKMGKMGKKDETFNGHISRGPWQQMIQACTGSLSTDEILTGNRATAARFTALQAKEDAAGQAKSNQQAAIRSAQEVTRDLTIKGLGLAATKAELQRIAGSRAGFWTCEKDPRSLNTEVCIGRFEMKACYDVMRGNDIAGRVRGTQCDTSFGDMEKMPEDLRNIATIGGVRVTEIQVYFYEGKAIDVTYFLKELSPNLREGLVQRYGQPTIEEGRDVARWYAKDTMLSWKADSLSLKNTTLWELRNQRTDEFLRRAQAEQNEKEQARMMKNKKDF